jgi:histone-lysine N-methyltransferase SUV420H
MATVAPRVEPAKDGASPLTAALAAVNKVQESAAAPGTLKPLPERMDASPLEPSLHQPAVDQSQALGPELISTEGSPMVEAKPEAVSAGQPGDEAPATDVSATDVSAPLADGADAFGDAAASEQPKPEETPIAALTEQSSVQDAEMGVLPPEGKDVAAAAAEAADSQQRRTSGRARKAPEMAAGQIPYKGSLVKLAAQRAKEAKSGPNSPRSTGAHSPDARNQSPKSSRFMTPTAEVAGELAETAGKGELEIAAPEEVVARIEGDGSCLGAGMGAATVASSHDSPMDLD